MSFQALLYCQDEKTTRVVTQVLTELDFQVEASAEHFGAVKKLASQHFDAVVVDCVSEDTAGLILKSARSSASNQASLIVAVVEGQAGVANAFRIGANLVLTKPIAVEQAKGTLRVARGLLRKGTDLSGAAPAPSAPAPATVNNAPTISAISASPAPPAPVRAASAVASAEPKQAVGVAKVQAEKSAPLNRDLTWKPPARPAAPIAARAAQEPARAVIPEAPAMKASEDIAPAAMAPSAPVSSAPSSTTIPAVRPATGAAAAPAPAKQRLTANLSEMGAPASPAAPAPASVQAAAPAPAKAAKTPLQKTETPDISHFAPKASSEERSRLPVLIPVILLVVAAAAYFGYSSLHKSVPAPQAAPIQAPTQTQNGASPAPASSASQPANSPRQDSAIIAPDSVVNPSETVSTKTGAPASTRPPSSGKAAVISNVEPGITNSKPAPAPLVVKADSRLRSSASANAAPVEAPPMPMSQSSSNALNSLTAAVSTLPKPVQSLPVSQGVSQGLLTHMVQPSYPPQARQMHVEGVVSLQATIGKDGSVRDVKVVSGPPMLARAAIDAVKQWRYKPYLLNGDPVEIQTAVSVNFRLPK